MKIYRLLPVAALALLAGCSGDNVANLITPEPHAAVRWVNAVPDTIDMDYRIVDIVTNANEASVKYRGTSGGYRALPPGSHRIRVFPSGTTTAACNGPSVVSKVLLDTTFTFAVNHYYTILHAGYMNPASTPKQRLIIIDDVFPAGAAGSFSLRAIDAIGNAASTDVFVTGATAAGGAVSGTAAFTGMSFGTVSAYKAVATAPSTPAASSYRVTATAASTTTPLLADGLLPIGAAAFAGSTSVPPLDPIGGSQQDASVLTTIATPPGVSYTLTSSGSSPSCPPAGTTTVIPATATGAIVSLVDKDPKAKLLGQ
ncbi:MAG: DUF4397 domain-containing protein [Gemmatimonadaceae bacterium]